ncbi:iron-containing alcohol dehydrogenase [Vallitalea guaymasensis]|uniref:Iron-containing alcohol dehydrogenase n=1 Tax=Vallitalea guaymasensis TaxID=1185412 RepID=A0A8J8SB78_9FIRM|nr:iron-containing alcohol dehydrogenase [Vallitalea guaymasensis]QUH28447.1 iron-containing alcohol dehydrogenase [Vallitalea guaymasensis]
MDKNNFSYYIPTKIFFGSGMINKLGEMKLPGEKALIVISSGTSMKKYGYLDKLCKLLEKNSCEYVVYDKIKPNPTYKNVMEGSEIAKKNNCDFVIGLGGGSSIDAAKSIAIMVTNEGDYWDYVHGGTGLGLPLGNKPLEIVAITTTAGTGTEADPWTVITKEDTFEKIGYGNNDTFPSISIVDPDLMMSVPTKLTAYQGFDALFHATEGYLANISNEISDMYALKSIELIGRSLAKAVNDGNDKEARTDMALANTLSGFVESTSSCISEHSLEHALSAYHPQLPHGAGLIMISESYYRFFMDKVPDRFIKMARALGIQNAEEPIDFVNGLLKLQKDCGVDELKLSDYGIQKDNLEMYAKNAMDTMGGLFELDPYKLTLSEATSILEHAYK